ncbi:uncharacterized protein E0L32_004171 [Thyridium curvatum]|uniref:Uncharacterized protein n=1 Tax=Thyridium curvatum TaxID=1093900 RepID=A0A507BAD9_9PEZI|nr:uncharacterized protein E0L32_004171 [Thyridium curvatum]TPX16176.1 hypothetical protein E0L32_004171 [Thyridium curvatum]
MATSLVGSEVPDEVLVIIHAPNRNETIFAITEIANLEEVIPQGNVLRDRNGVMEVIWEEGLEAFFRVVLRFVRNMHFTLSSHLSHADLCYLRVATGTNHGNDNGQPNEDGNAGGNATTATTAPKEPGQLVVGFNPAGRFGVSAHVGRSGEVDTEAYTAVLEMVSGKGLKSQTIEAVKAVTRTAIICALVGACFGPIARFGMVVSRLF